MVTKVKSVKKPIRNASTEKSRIQDRTKVEIIRSKVLTARNSVSDIASKKTKMTAMKKPIINIKPAAANSMVQVSRQPVKSKVMAWKKVEVPVKPEKKTGLLKETKNPVKAQAIVVVKSGGSIKKKPVESRVKPVAHQVQKPKVEKKPVLKLKADSKSVKIKPVVKAPKVKTQTRNIKPVNKVKKLEKPKVEVKAKTEIKKQVTKVAQPVAKSKLVAKSKTPAKEQEQKKTLVGRWNNKKITKSEKALKSALLPTGIVMGKTQKSTKVAVRPAAPGISKAKPEKTVVKAKTPDKKASSPQPVKAVEKPKTRLVKTVAKIDELKKKTDISQPIKNIESKPDPVPVKIPVVSNSEQKSLPEVEAAPVAQSSAKKSDRWSDCGQVFFTAGKAYGLTPSLRTICIGNDTDVLDFFRAGATHGRLNNQQKTVLHNIVESRQSEGKSLDVVIPEPVVELHRQRRTPLRKKITGRKTVHRRPVLKNRPDLKSRPAGRRMSSVRG